MLVSDLSNKDIKDIKKAFHYLISSYGENALLNAHITKHGKVVKIYLSKYYEYGTCIHHLEQEETMGKATKNTKQANLNLINKPKEAKTIK